MPEHAALPHLRETILFLVLAGVLIPLLEKRAINPVLGFLAVGTVVGPYGLGALAGDYPWLANISFTSSEDVATFAELGVVFLMFTIGLEMSVERLWAMRRQVFGGGGAQVLLSTALITAIATAWGHAFDAALILGLVLAFSSTAVVMQLLSQRRDLGTPLGRTGFAILLFQDLAVVPLLVLIGVMGQKASPDGFIALLAVAAIKGVLTVAAIYLLGSRVVRPMFGHLASTRAPDTFTALTLLASLGVAALTWAAGLSMAMGAMLAGLIIAETEFRHEVEVTIEPFKGLLMGLFFMSVGMGIDLHALLDHPLMVPLSVAGLMLLKGLILFVLLRLMGLSWGRSTEGGILLSQGGEFAFIVIGVAMHTDLLPEPIGHFMLLVVGLSMLATPLASRLGRSLGDRIDAHLGRHDTVDEIGATPAAGHVIVAGCGRVGEMIGQMLTQHRLHHVALDSDAKLVERLRKRGVEAYYGDAGRPELLRRLKLDQARAVILTMGDEAAVSRAVGGIRRLAPAICVVARARDEAHAMALRLRGADAVIPETLEVGLQLAGATLELLGFGEDDVRQSLEHERVQRIERVHEPLVNNGAPVADSASEERT
ncbi:MAG: cation:proton antiporter [Rhodocyclaceae bacterium]|nr:cation:proton antiporter [Rhodocyclaceae bacterium]